MILKVLSIIWSLIIFLAQPNKVPNLWFKLSYFVNFRNNVYFPIPTNPLLRFFFPTTPSINPVLPSGWISGDQAYQAYWPEFHLVLSSLFFLFILYDQLTTCQFCDLNYVPCEFCGTACLMPKLLVCFFNYRCCYENIVWYQFI